MNNMAKKLIKDASEVRRARINLISYIIGGALLLFGLILILIKAVSVEYIDEDGFLHENFFLLPIGFLFIISGFISFLITGLTNLIRRLKSKNKG